MKKTIIILILLILTIPISAEVRIGINTEFYNSLFSLTGIEDIWGYTLTGNAALSFKNKGSRVLRGEISLDFTEAGQNLIPSLRKLYIRPDFGDIRVSVGKTRSTWGAGFAFNAGDLIFGSDSVNFDTKADDPRTETAWLTNIEFPLGDFSFLEIITLPGNIDFTDPSNPVIPTLEKTSAGARISFEAGDFNIQTGYLYRGDLIAGLGSKGHEAFISLEGISPVNWHLSTSAANGIENYSGEMIKESWMITGGCSWDHLLGKTRDLTLSWQIEFIARPFHSFENDHSGDYAIYIYPSVTYIPGGTAAYSISSIISPVDSSANTTLGVSWNIYEELTLLGYYSIQTGKNDDTFNLNKAGGMSCTIGGRYSY